MVGWTSRLRATCGYVLLSAGVSAAPACRGAESSEPSDPPAGAEDNKDKDKPGGFGGMSSLAKMFAGGLDKPGPYEEPRESENYADGAKHFVVVELSGPLAELEAVSWFDMAATKPVHKFTDKLAKAAADDNVAGLVLRTSRLALPMSVAQDLRQALTEFKGDGKRRVVCHTEGVSNAAYHLLTACDKIGLAPLGDISIPGPAATPIHIKGLLDRTGVKADVIHIGAFKGAAEPLTRDAPSEEMLETLKAIVDQNYETLLVGLEARGLGRDDAVAAIDKAMFLGDQAVEAKLVDEVGAYEAFVASATDGAAWRTLKQSKNPLEDLSRLQRFLGMMPAERPSDPHVAVVYAVGMIIDGKGGGAIGAREEIASRTLVAALRALAREETVKAVVLRVDSGGGSALASEQIWSAVSDLAAAKPVVASMGSVAASGGYYISAGATKIYARENTLTGSIGVVGGKVVYGPALEPLGVKMYDVHRGERAAMNSPMRLWSDAERQAVRELMETTYERFLQRVASGRKMERDAVHAIAQGRVWTGAAAKANGLVDEVGGLDAALAEAAKLAGLEAGGPVEVYPPDPTLRDILSSFGQVQSSTDPITGARELLGPLPHPFAEVAEILGTLSALRSSRIWALSWVKPPV